MNSNFKSVSKEKVIEDSIANFDKGYACSQSILLAFASYYSINETTAKLISSTFGGGMGRLREKCGALTGAFMVLGLEYGNVNPQDMETKLHAYKKVRELNNVIQNIHGTTSCSGLLQKHATSSEVEARQHHKIICRRVVGEVAEALYDIIQKDKN